MSRIGNKPVVIPEKVEVSIKDMTISVKGPKGELSTTVVDERITFEVNEGILTFSRNTQKKYFKHLQNTIPLYTAQFFRKIPIQLVHSFSLMVLRLLEF